MYNFILKDDFKAIATDIDLDVLSSANELIIRQCNKIAIAEASGYLNTRYNLLKLFKDPTLYNVASPYLMGDRIYVIDGDIYKHYICILDTPAGEDITTKAFFKEEDSRDQKLLQVVMSISLFYIHMRLTPDNIPAFRVEYYDGGTDKDEVMSAIRWLTLIQKGDLNPYNWPEVEDENVGGLEDPYELEGADPSVGFMWGSDRGEEYHWYNQWPNPNIINSEQI
jgi:hypothetical protein